MQVTSQLLRAAAIAALPVPPATSSTDEPPAGLTLSTSRSATIGISAAMAP